MLYFSLQNARPEREREPLLRGGLRTDGFILGSWSDRPRIGNDVSTVFSKFLSAFGCHFAWQAQYFVSLDGDICCSAHCK